MAGKKINLTDQLKNYFGFDTFKGNQEAIIQNLLAGNDTFVLMPTGGGKSLCYQLPSLLMDGTAIVISPLIALMKNQVDAMRNFSEEDGIAHFINSSLNKSAIDQVKSDILAGRTKLLYVAPESLTKEENVEFLKTVKISFYAVDEAHCISEWGHDFRPEYRRIRPIINEIGKAPLIALTATATPKVHICGIPTNSLNKTFATLYKSFDKANYMDGLKAAFLLLDSYKRFPNDTEFTTFLQTKDVYNFRNRNYLLNRLENFQRKEMVNISDYTIEHVMPQNSNLSHEWQEMLGEGWVEVQGKYLHTLGNLTLTGYNSELSDRPFQEKKSMEGGFDDSPIRLNSYLRRISSWNEEQILVRAGQLAEKAKEIWRFPLLSPETLEVYRSAERDPAEYTLEHYEYLKGDILTLFQALRRRIMNIDPSVKEELKKLYIAFKAYTNFVDVVPQKSRLRLSLNVAFADILDPKGLCKDVSNLGRWGNGDVEVGISNMNELDDIMELIQQAFDKQMEAN